jgi:hypothetical protein
VPLESFISEHSAEYVLVPDIVRRLTGKFARVMPIFLWLSREGNSTALRMMAGKRVRLLTAFPRRPKVLAGSEDRITMKVNRELPRYSAASADAGIAVVVGVPLVSSLSTLRVETECCWFELSGCATTGRDYFVEIGRDGTVISNDAPAGALSGPLSDAQIEDAANRCEAMPWGLAVEKVRRVRSLQAESRGYPFFGGYKPFHLMLLGP